MDLAGLDLKADHVAGLIRGYRYYHASERELQDGLERVFREHRITYSREHHLGPGDIIDFLLQGGVGVEVKVGGGLSEVTRQLYRYAAYGTVAELVLVSSRCRLDRMPETMRGKPLRVAVVSGAFV